MFRIIKLIFLGVVGLALVLLGVANMAPVDLHLAPQAVVGSALTLPGVPLAGVILAAVLLGIIVGQVIEWLRERKYRRLAEEKRREITTLRGEIARLRRKLGEAATDLPRMIAE